MKLACGPYMADTKIIIIIMMRRRRRRRKMCIRDSDRTVNVEK